MTLKVDRVSSLHTAASALPGLRAPQLQLALQDMVANHFHAGQHLWLHLPHSVVVQASTPPLPLPVPVWLLVQAWAHAAVAAGTTRLQIPSFASALYAAPLAQPGDTTTVHHIPAPLLPASSITLRRLVSDNSVATGHVMPGDRSAAPSSGGSSFQPAFDSFISAALLKRPCYVGMTLSVELFNSTQHLTIDAIEPLHTSHSASPPAVYVASADTEITLIKHHMPTSANEPTSNTQAVDFCQHHPLTH